jgi:hypothetical protein
MNHFIAPSSRIEVVRPHLTATVREKGTPHSSSMRAAPAAIRHLWVQKGDDRRNAPQTGESRRKRDRWKRRAAAPEQNGRSLGGPADYRVAPVWTTEKEASSV